MVYRLEIPVLETDRLRLREFRPASDFEPYADFYASDGTRFYGGPLNREQAWRTIAAMMGHWVMRGYGPWAVEEKASGAFCGIVGLYNPEGWPEREITWAITEPKQRRGYALEAAICAKRYARDILGWDTAASCIAEGNLGSIALAEKMGATLYRRTAHSRHGQMLIYRHQMHGLAAN
ncbi:MAG: GNAT family N-acetyltransferase [Pseudomonadota bacterium]